MGPHNRKPRAGLQVKLCLCVGAPLKKKEKEKERERGRGREKKAQLTAVNPLTPAGTRAVLLKQWELKEKRPFN